MKELVINLPIWAIATDPIYIGTGGYTIGRVDNTIVRDPITRIPKFQEQALLAPGDIIWHYAYKVYLKIITRSDHQ